MEDLVNKVPQAWRKEKKKKEKAYCGHKRGGEGEQVAIYNNEDRNG